MQRHVGTALGTLVVAGLLSGCASGVSTANFTAPEEYETVEQLVADADVVALVQAGASNVEVVDRVPYTRTELQVRKVLLGALSNDARLAVTQVGSEAAPPGDGLPEVLRDGQQYVVVLHRTAAGEFEVVGPGVWRADGMGATLTLHTAMAACVPPAIPHLTTPWELEVELGEVGGALSTSAIGQTDATGTHATGTHTTGRRWTGSDATGTDATWHYSAWHDAARADSTGLNRAN